MINYLQKLNNVHNSDKFKKIQPHQVLFPIDWCSWKSDFLRFKNGIVYFTWHHAWALIVVSDYSDGHWTLHRRNCSFRWSPHAVSYLWRRIPFITNTVINIQSEGLWIRVDYNTLNPWKVDHCSICSRQIGSNSKTPPTPETRINPKFCGCQLRCSTLISKHRILPYKSCMFWLTSGRTPFWQLTSPQ